MRKLQASTVAKKLWNTLLFPRNGNQRVVCALFMHFTLIGTVVMQIVSTGFARGLEQFV